MAVCYIMGCNVSIPKHTYSDSDSFQSPLGTCINRGDAAISSSSSSHFLRFRVVNLCVWSCPKLRCFQADKDEDIHHVLKKGDTIFLFMTSLPNAD